MPPFLGFPVKVFALYTLYIEGFFFAAAVLLASRALALVLYLSVTIHTASYGITKMEATQHFADYRMPYSFILVTVFFALPI